MKNINFMANRVEILWRKLLSYPLKRECVEATAEQDSCLCEKKEH